jgi:hypothetical protein
MTTATESRPQRHRPVDPRERGVLGCSKYYLTMLVTTEQGRWSVLLLAALQIINNQVQMAVYPGIAGFSPDYITLQLNIAMIVVSAALLNVTLDLARAESGDGDLGGEA